VVNLQSLVQELQDKYEVIPMSSGSRALRYLKRETVDLILLDVLMPEMDGIETLENIRERSDGLMIPVIFLTASNDRETVMKGMRLGIVDFIVKPFQREDLRFRIDRTLKKQGVVPVERWELYQAVSDLSGFIEEEHWKKATLKATEIVRYKASEDVIKRVKTVLQKLEVGDYQAARQIVGRVMQMLNSQADSKGKKSDGMSQLEWSMKLHDVLESLDQFNTQGAIEKMNLLMGANMPEEHRESCQQVMACLQDCDDMEAEKLIIQILDDVTSAI
jgi:response regulator RpfG family c-di-GMP phosphodiesterase